MSSDASESLAAARLIDARCDEFEQALRAGRSPVIELFLTDLSDQHRQTLLLELLGLEIDYRATRGDELAVSDYAARFPKLPSEQIATLIKSSRASRDAVPAQPPEEAASLQPTLLAPANAEGKPRPLLPRWSATSATTNYCVRSLAAGWASCTRLVSGVSIGRSH